MNIWLGLDAIECVHQSQEASYAQKVMNLAKKNS